MNHLTRTAQLAVAVLMLGSGVRAFADNTSATQGADGGTFYSPLPKKVQEDIGDIRPAADAGVLSYFHGQASVNAQYTSNAALYHSKDDADFLIAPVLQGGFTAPLNKNFTLDLEARLEDFTYSSNQSLGFYGASGNANIEYRYKPSWPRIYVGVEPYYYFSYDTGDRLTSAIGPVAGVDQALSINRGKTLLFMGYHFGQYFASPGIDTRQSHTVSLSLTQQLRRDYYAQLYWQLQYSDYTVYGRDETRDVVGVSVIHQFTPQTFASLFVNYVDNASNNALAKYTTVNAGFSLVWQF
jgi:hypothetical protein